MTSDYKSIATYAGIGLVLITVSISLLIAVYRSKVIRRHMSGVLLANLALVGIFSFWSDVAVELERELMERSIMLGEIGCHMLVNLALIIRIEFYFIMIILGIDRVLVMVNKTFYERRAWWKIVVTFGTWLISSLLVVSIYWFTHGDHISYKPHDRTRRDYKAECAVAYEVTDAEGDMNMGGLTASVPTLLIFMAVELLVFCVFWFRASRSILKLDPREKAQNIAFFISQVTLLICSILFEFTADLHSVALLELLLEPLIMLYWLVLVPELRQGLCCCREQEKEEDKGALIMENKTVMLQPASVTDRILNKPVDV